MDKRFTAFVDLEDMEIPYWDVKTRHFFREKDASDFHLEKNFQHHVACWCLHEGNNQELLVSFAFSNDKEHYFKDFLKFFALQRISILREKPAKDNTAVEYKKGHLSPKDKVFCNLFTYSGNTYLTEIPYALVINYQDFVTAMQYMSNIESNNVIPIEIMRKLDFRFVSKFMIESFLARFNVNYFNYLSKRLSEKV